MRVVDVVPRDAKAFYEASINFSSTTVVIFFPSGKKVGIGNCKDLVCARQTTPTSCRGTAKDFSLKD